MVPFLSLFIYPSYLSAYGFDLVMTSVTDEKLIEDALLDT